MKTMKHTKFFSFGLFRESFRQMRMPAVLAFVIFSIEAILMPLAQVISALNNWGSEWRDFVTPQTVIGLEVHWISIAAIYLVAPLLTIVAFGYLNHRNASDFYHSIPHTRRSVFISTYAAVAAWLAVILFGSGLISWVMVTVLPDFYALVGGTMIKLLLNCFVGSLFTVSATVLAMTITGTVFNNLIVTALIVFLPRFIILLFSAVLTSELPMLVFEYMPWLLSNGCNITNGLVFGLFIEVFGGNNAVNLMNLLTGIAPRLYTLVAALAYAALACWFYHRRKSESAGLSAPSPLMQHVFRITVTMVPCIGIVMFIFSSRRYLGLDELFGCFVLYVIAVLIYFIYELITTKKWKNVLKAVPGLGIVLLLNIVCYLALSGLYTVQRDYSPDADDIDSVSIMNSIYRAGSRMTFADYVGLKTGDISLEDEQVKTIVANSLRKTVEARQYQDKTGDSQTYRPDNSITVVVKIDTGLTSRYRQIYLSTLEYSQIQTVLAQKSASAELWTTVPDVKGAMYFNMGGSGEISMLENSAGFQNELLTSLQSELSAATVEQVQNAFIVNTNPVIGNLYMDVVIDNMISTVVFPIHPDLTPRSCTMLMEYIHQNQQDEADRMLTMLENNLETVDYFRVGLYTWYKEQRASGHFYFGYYEDMPEEELEDIREVCEFLLTYVRNEPIDPAGPYVEIYGNFRDVEDRFSYMELVLPLAPHDLEDVPERLRDDLSYYNPDYGVYESVKVAAADFIDVTVKEIP